MTLPVLRTARLMLRPIAAEDVEPLFALYSDAAAMRYWSCPPFTDLASLREWLLPAEPSPCWTVLMDEAVVGRVMLAERRPGVAEIGYGVVPAFWRQGIAREALSAAIGHGFDEAAYRRIFADIDPDNAGSIRLVEALGFAFEGRLRDEWETHIGVRDSLIYGLLAADWRDTAPHN